jgi:photosystem II stability/assembly factor-like uncharacterized protein
MFALADSILYVSTDSAKTWAATAPLTALSPRLVAVAGSGPLLAALTAERGRVLISMDTARTWMALPAIPSGGDTVITDVAVQSGQVLAGTRNAGVFAWGDPGPTAVRQQASGGSVAPARSFRRGWRQIPGQGFRYRLDSRTQVDANGRSSLPPRNKADAQGR